MDLGEELEIGPPERPPGGYVCFTRIPNTVMEMLINNQCRLVKKGNGCCVIMSEGDDIIGELKSSATTQTKSRKFDGFLIRNGDTWTPIDGSVREFECKGLIKQADKIPKKKKKSAIIMNQVEMIDSKPKAPGIGWNSQKTFEAIRALKKRFSEDENDITGLLNELRSQVTKDPRSIDSRTLATVFEDIDNFKKDMTGCHVMLRKLRMCLENM